MDDTGDDGKKPDKNRTGRVADADRGAKGRFVSGNKANPCGRPRGSQNQTTKLVASLLAGEAEDLTRALIRRAKSGNATALGVIFARLAPAPKDRPIEIPLPPLTTLDDVANAHDIVLARVGSGDITPSEALSLSQLLERKRQALEATQLEARIAALEQRAQSSKGKE